jgi:LuxR family transcriptional regulator, maltose regulon positive regulatory protein
VTVTRDRPRSRARAGAPPSWFVPLESKLHVPPTRPGIVPRTRLLERLRAAGSSTLIVIDAPLGYGKTSLLAQWAEEDERPFLWLTLDDADNDASRLLVYLVIALNEAFRVGPEVFPRPPEPGPGFVAFSLPRIARALSTRVQPFVLVLDDVQVLHDRHALDVLAMIVDNLPEGSQLVLAGRDPPPLQLSRVLVSRSMTRLRTPELAMTSNEATQLLHAAGLPVGGSESAMLVERTEGWPAALYLAAVALREERHLGRALESFAGSDALVLDYLRDEMLDGLTRGRLAFMLGTAVLDRVSGPLCDAVLQTTGSAQTLEEMERANLFLMPTDRKRVWFRRHQLFADVLLAELRRRDPGQESVQHRRAAEWFEESGHPDAALDHARASGDLVLAGEIIARHVVEYVSSGRASTVRRWIESLPSTAYADAPWFGVAAALAYVSSGNVDRAMHWLAVGERGRDDDGPLPDGRASLRSGIAITRAALAMEGIDQLAADAALGYTLEPENSPWRAFCAFLEGVALHLQGRSGDALARLHEAVSLSSLEQPNVHAWALAQLAICAMHGGDLVGARDFAEQARVEVERTGLQEYAPAALVYAASALACAHWRQPAEARRDAARATRSFALLSGLAPWLSTEGRVVAAETYLALGDPAHARESLRAAERDLSRLGNAPVLRARFEAARRAATGQAQVTNGPPLTAAEIRVVQYLPTHLSFREIAARLHVSRNTVKTQVMSSYRKLGASSRTEAVELAKALALLDLQPSEVNGAAEGRPPGSGRAARPAAT